MKKGALVKIKRNYFQSEDICIILSETFYTSKNFYYFDKESKSVKNNPAIVTECFVYNAVRNKILKIDLKDLTYV